jgi:hypothetical protein
VTFILDIIEALVYVFLAAMLLLHYLRSKDEKRRHILLAFGFAAAGFLFNVLDDIIWLLGNEALAKVSFKLFDAFLMVGATYFFVFLTDFNKKLKPYIWAAIPAVVIVIALILVMPQTYVVQGIFWTVVRSKASGLALVIYWTMIFATLSISFFNYARLTEEKLPRLRMRLLAGGGIAAVLSYLSAVFFKFSLPTLLIPAELTSSLLAIVAGILFYLGAETPKTLKKMVS